MNGFVKIECWTHPSEIISVVRDNWPKFHFIRRSIFKTKDDPGKSCLAITLSNNAEKYL
jgi:hypothetical protein